MGYLYLFNELDYEVIPWYRLIIEEAENGHRWGMSFRR